jgi:hypothetical protein
MKNKMRGSALIESIPVMILLLIFCVGLLSVAYLLFARAWIGYQSEQALYCAAEMALTSSCQKDLQSRLQRFLPWGEVTTQVESHSGQWLVEVQWQWRKYVFHLRKVLNAKLIVNAKDLHW